MAPSGLQGRFTRAPMYITHTDALADFCEKLQGAPYIAVDTEFLRERTYYAQLCLVQVAYGENAAVIDVLAPDLDMGPLRALLLDPGILKVFHAATQDLAIFFQKIGQIPAPVFDTQIAAAACGHGEQVGYAALAQRLLGVEIDKASQATDWSLRPLTERQLVYALGDVTFLCQLYEKLADDLLARDRLTWVQSDMNALCAEGRYAVDPQLSYLRLRTRHPSRKTLAVLRELAAWREHTAMERDLPLSWVVHDDALIEIAQNTPRDLGELARVRALKPGVAKGADGKALLACVQRALSLPPAEWPSPPDRKASADESLVALLTALLRLRAEAHGVAARLVATREELDQLATGATSGLECLTGWRREMFGEDALALRAGRLALTGHKGGVTVVSRPG